MTADPRTNPDGAATFFDPGMYFSANTYFGVISLPPVGYNTGAFVDRGSSHKWQDPDHSSGVHFGP